MQCLSLITPFISVLCTKSLTTSKYKRVLIVLWFTAKPCIQCYISIIRMRTMGSQWARVCPKGPSIHVGWGLRHRMAPNMPLVCEAQCHFYPTGQWLHFFTVLAQATLWPWIQPLFWQIYANVSRRIHKKNIDFEVFNAVVFMVLHFTDRSHLDHNFLMVDSSQTNTANTRTSVWPTGNWNTDCFYYSHKWSNTPQLTLEGIYLDWDLFISMYPAKTVCNSCFRYTFCQ